MFNDFERTRVSSEFVKRSYEEGDESQIVPLLDLAFEKWPFFDIECSPLEHWRWRYIGNSNYEPLICVILFEREIIAVAHNVLNNMVVNGKQYLGSYGTDACVHPKFQGRGLYGILAKTIYQMEKRAGVDFTYMVSNNPKVLASRSQKKVTPYPFPHKVRYLTRIKDINLHIQMKGIKDKYRWKLRYYVDLVRSSPIKPPDQDKQIFQIKRFDKNIDTFLDKVYEKLNFINHRTKDYLNWRYLDSRAGNYNVRVVQKNGKIMGYVVFRINKIEEYYTGYIVDLLTLPGRLDITEALLLDGLGFFSENQVNQIVFQVLENHPHMHLFNKYGFFGGDANRQILYNNFGPNFLRLENIPLDKFHFSFGDLTGI